MEKDIDEYIHLEIVAIVVRRIGACSATCGGADQLFWCSIYLGDFGFLRHRGVKHETRVQDALNHDGMN